MQTITFGETSGTAWRTLGVNLDGKSSTGVSTDVCQPAAGGSPNVAYPDGDNGIDNSFGKNVLPTLQAINPNWVSLLNNDISGGQATALMKLLCLPPSGDVPLLVSKVFNATPMPLGMQPQWLGSDAWPVRPELLQDVNDAESSALVFPSGSITGSTFNAGPGGTFVLNFPLQGPSASMELHLVIHDAHVTMTLDSSRTGATAGVIGGVLDTEELVLEFRKLGVLMGACGNPVLANVITQVRQASDIQADGGQDPTVTCDGISIGVGFTMGPAMLGGVGPFLDGGALCP